MPKFKIWTKKKRQFAKNCTANCVKWWPNGNCQSVRTANYESVNCKNLLLQKHCGALHFIKNKLTCGDRSSNSISLSFSYSPAVADFVFVAMINGVFEKSTCSNTLEDGLLLFFFMVILWIEVDLASSEGLSLKLDTKLVFAKLL